MIKKTIFTLIVFISLFGLTQNVLAWNTTMTITDNGTSYSFYCSGSPCNVGLWNGTGNGIKYTDSSDTVTIQKSSLSDGSYQWIASPNINYFDMSFADWHDWKSNYDSMSGYGTFTISSAPPAILGCMDSQASNFNPNATVENYDCTYNTIDLALNNFPHRFALPNMQSPTWSIAPHTSTTVGYTSGNAFIYNQWSVHDTVNTFSGTMSALTASSGQADYFLVGSSTSNVVYPRPTYWTATQDMEAPKNISQFPNGEYFYAGIMGGLGTYGYLFFTVQNGVITNTYTKPSLSVYPVVQISGCMDSGASNYNASANIESYDCTYPVNENIYMFGARTGNINVASSIEINGEPLFSGNTIQVGNTYEIYKNWSWNFCKDGPTSMIDNTNCSSSSKNGLHRLTVYQPVYFNNDSQPVKYSTYSSYVSVSDLPDGDYYFMSQMIEGYKGLFFHVSSGKLTKNFNNFTAIFNPTCHDGIKNQDETSIDTGGVCSVITTTHVDPFADCEGIDFICYVKSTFQWLFTIDSSSFSPLVAQFDTVKTHVPLNYIYYVSDFWSSLANGSATIGSTLSIPIGNSSITLFSPSLLSSNPVAPLVRGSLVVVLWIMLMLALYYRGIHLFDSDVTPMHTKIHI